MKCPGDAAAALSLPPATTGNPAGGPTRVAISDFSLPAIAQTQPQGNKAGLIFRALEYLYPIAVALFKHPHHGQQTDLSLIH